MSRQEDFIQAGIDYRMEHGKPMCIADSYTQCIPFEGNEHLLGTTDMPSEEYINW